MREDAPFAGACRFGIDGHDDALAAELLGCLAHEVGPRYRGRIDRDLVGTGQQQRADILDPAHPAAHRERHETLLGGAADHVIERVAPLMAGRDVEEAELVGAGCIIDPRLLDRVARIPEIDEIDALDDAAILHVEAGDDAHLEHQADSPSSSASAAAGSIRPS